MTARQLVLGPRHDPPPVLVVLGVLAGCDELARQAMERFAASLGGPQLVGDQVPFDHTDYYEAEMGPALRRTFCACSRLVAPQRLPELKAAAWTIEHELAHDGRRRVNLDPGYLDLTKVVLASFKPGPQKLYLGNGVWADMVLFFERGGYRPLQWTFPDLGDGSHDAFFASARQWYRKALKGLASRAG